MDGSSIDQITSSESKSITSPPGKKLRRAGSVIIDAGFEEASSRKVPSSQFKGVVSQPNAQWGAQIYDKHKRVWLGTFKDEEVAARAFDVASHRFRGRDAAPNFNPLSDDEIAFLNSHSKDEIVDMLRKHTYRDELAQSLLERGDGRGSSRSTGPDRQLYIDWHVTDSGLNGPIDTGRAEPAMLRLFGVNVLEVPRNSGGDES
ncbi:hypothetical protein SASPL_118748 [Salvia splendens]|uniref:AP2/ERF domain-containing protein n=1 Tax=Salvia splendens TaxID=180675 RepID=A0A8X8Y092_SALSN|nr:hypothetical protein SASPL_118748 [Salvia splendens]